MEGVFCLVCQKKLTSVRGLSRHLSNQHSIAPEEYTLKYLCKGVRPVCSCGCGVFTQYAHKRYKFNDYNHNHHKPTLGRIMSDEQKRKMSLRYEKNRIKKLQEQTEKEKDYPVLCLECMSRRFKNNSCLSTHLNRIHKMSCKEYVLKFKYNSVEPLCQCGCGEVASFRVGGVFDFANFIHGHKTIKQKQAIQSKIKKTNFKKYGVENVFQRTNFLEEVKLSEEEIQKRCRSKNYAPLFSYENYTGNRQELKFKCVEHNKEFYSCLFNVSNEKNYQCPSCRAVGVSVGEKEVVGFVNSVYSKEVVENTRKIIPPKELDIWIPDRKLGIEYCGLYWHSSANKNFVRNAHRNKAKLMHEQGHSFFLFFEDEWKTKQHLIQQMIKYRLGLIKSKIFARKCKVVEFSKNKDFKDFFNKYHLDGHTSASRAIGLTYKNELVSCMSIRTNFRGETEIARFANNCDCVVVGAASKLLSLLPRPIVTFSNNRLSEGGVYKQFGFEEITQTVAPSYWYTDLETRTWRFKCRRYNVHKGEISQEEFDKYPTEYDQAVNGVFSRKIFGDERPLYRIEDCGHRKWLLK